MINSVYHIIVNFAWIFFIFNGCDILWSRFKKRASQPHDDLQLILTIASLCIILGNVLKYKVLFYLP